MILLLLVSLGLYAGGFLSAAEVKQGVPAKNIQTVKFQSDSVNEQRSFNILLPLDYETSVRRYPVLYLLHGYGDDNTAWSYMTDLSSYAAQHEIIIVMPDGSKSWFVNYANDPKSRFEDYIVKDLVGYVDSHYRSIPLPRSRAIAGLSMGGYGAVFLGLKHYDKFSAIGSFSGAIAIARGDHDNRNAGKDREFQEELQMRFGPKGSPARAERDPFVLFDKVPAARMPYLYIACGGQDELVKENRDFVAMLAAKKIPYEYREVSPRIHAWDFWDDNVRIFLGLLQRRAGFGK
jgi:putative tributyrin esterase